MTVTLTAYELLALMALTALLTATDAARISRLLLAAGAKKLNVEPEQIRRTETATNPSEDGNGGEHGKG